MNMYIPRDEAGNIIDALRKAGYSYFIDPVTQESSFICRLGSDFYPRFHVYVTESEQDYTISLHLDQKQASYENAHAHNGEYEGPHIEAELRRIFSWIQHCSEIKNTP